MLHRVAGVVEQRHVGALDLGGEIVDRGLHGAAIRVQADQCLEPEALERGGDVLGIVARIFQLGTSR